MPKATIYLPDELWESLRARAAREGANTSQLIQTALKRLFNDSDRPSFASTPPQVERATIDRLRDRLAKEARDLYESGFRRGVALAEKLTWSQLDRLAAVEWDMSKWGATGDDVSQLILDELVDQDWLMYGGGVDVDPLSYHQGLVDSLRFVWQAVAHGDNPPNPAQASTKEVMSDG